MRLEITRRSDLAIRSLLLLLAADGRQKAAELAAEVGSTPGFLTQTLTPLVQQGWVRSDPGPRGGYVATVAPDDVSVLDVIEAIEGPTDTGRCVLEDRRCAEAGTCALHASWAGARTRLIDDLAGQTLADLQRTVR